jgi:hypothetical protein
MDADEREIYYYLKGRRREFIPIREISRRTGGKRRWRRSPEWARPVVERMAERGILEGGDESGYRLKPKPRAGKTGKLWVSPQLAEILKASGKVFDNVVTDEYDDDYYESL